MLVEKSWLGHTGLFLMLVVFTGACDKLRKSRGEEFALISVNSRPVPLQGKEPCTSGDGKAGTGGLNGTQGRLLLGDDSTFRIQSDLNWTCGGPGWGEGSVGHSWAGSYSRTGDALSFVETQSGHGEFSGKRDGSFITITGITVDNRSVELMFVNRGR